MYLVENPRKKESVNSELARGRVSKFYWWVAIRSRGRLQIFIFLGLMVGAAYYILLNFENH